MALLQWLSMAPEHVWLPGQLDLQLWGIAAAAQSTSPENALVLLPLHVRNPRKVASSDVFPANNAIPTCWSQLAVLRQLPKAIHALLKDIKPYSYHTWHQGHPQMLPQSLVRMLIPLCLFAGSQPHLWSSVLHFLSLTFLWTRYIYFPL